MSVAKDLCKIISEYLLGCVLCYLALRFSYLIAMDVF